MAATAMTEPEFRRRRANVLVEQVAEPVGVEKAALNGDAFDLPIGGFQQVLCILDTLRQDVPTHAMANLHREQVREIVAIDGESARDRIDGQIRVAEFAVDLFECKPNLRVHLIFVGAARADRSRMSVPRGVTPELEQEVLNENLQHFQTSSNHGRLQIR